MILRNPHPLFAGCVNLCKLLTSLCFVYFICKTIIHKFFVMIRIIHVNCLEYCLAPSSNSINCNC